MTVLLDSDRREAYNGATMIRTVACCAALALLLDSAGAALAATAQAAPGDRWLNPQVLMDAGANSLAELELRGEVGDLRGVEREKALFMLGLTRERLGDYDGAQDAFAQVPAQSAWYPRAELHLARIFAAEGNSSASVAAYQAVIPTLTGNQADQARLHLGDELYAGGQFELALRQYSLLEHAKLDSVREAAWYGEGWSALEAGLDARSYYAFSQILDLFPDSPRILEARLNLVNHFLRLGLFDPAADQIRAVAAMPGIDQASASAQLGVAVFQLVASSHDRAKLAALELPALADFVAAEGAANDGDWVRAIAHYQAVPADSRWAEEAAYGLGWVLWRAGRLPQAEDQLEDTLRRYPDGTLKAATLFALGRVQEDRGERPDAQESYQQAQRQGKSKWAEQALYELASMALADRHVDDAERWARKLEARYPTGHFAAPGLWLLAEAELAGGDPKDAIANYARLAQHPEALDFLQGKSNPVVFKLGIAYLRGGDPASALKALAQVRGHLADEATFWRGEASYDLKRYEQAANFYATYLKRGNQAPYAPEASYGLAWALLERGDRKGARAAFAQAAKTLLEPKLAHDAYYRLSLLDMDRGDYEAARQALQSAVAIVGDGPDEEAHFLLAYSQMRAGDVQAAAQGFSTLIAEDPDSERGRQARRDLADCDLQLGKFAEAGQLLADLAQSEPASASDVVDLEMQAATAYSAASENDKAASLYDLIAVDGSASVKVRQSVLRPLVDAYVKAGSLSQAEGVLTGQASGSVWAPDALREVADAYAQNHQWREAAATYAEIPHGGLDVQIARAQALEQAGSLPDAATLFETLAASPSAQQPQILIDLASLYGQMGAMNRARKTLGRLDRTHADQMDKAQAWFDFGDLAFRKADNGHAVEAFEKAAYESRAGAPLAYQATYWLGSALVADGQPKRAIGILKPLIHAKAPADPTSRQAWQSWRSLALLELAEAHEHLRQWLTARSIYREMTRDPLVGARDKNEAEARLAFIKQNVPAELLRGR